jgi:predicted transcriptional regulator
MTATELQELEHGTEPIESAKENPWLDLVQDAADIVDEKLPPVVEIIEGILPEECKLVIAGAAKTFKTWVTLYASLAISHGIPFLGRKTARRRVVYCNLELRSVTFKRRIQVMAKALGIEIERDWFIHLPLRGKLAGVPSFEIVARIIGIVKEKKSVVVLDPTYKLLANAEENNSGAMTALFNEIDRLTTEAQSTVIMPDHFSKGNKSETDPLDAIRGSSAKAGDVDAAMVIRQHDVENCFRVDVIHRELPPIEPFVLEWSFPLMKLRGELDPANMRKAGRTKKHEPRKLLAFIVETSCENPISISAWANLTKIHRTTLQDYLPEMRRQGLIQTIGEGNNARQYITNKGKALLNGGNHQ